MLSLVSAPPRPDGRLTTLIDPEQAQTSLIRCALDALDLAVFVLSPDLTVVHHCNSHARRLCPAAPSAELIDAVRAYIDVRHDPRRLSAANRVQLRGRNFFLRVNATTGTPPAEVVVLREQVVRNAEMMRLLQSRFGVSRREYLVLGELRLGRTNREIAAQLGIAEGTAARHVHRLLERFSVPNRTRLVDVVERLVANGG